jgi:hypothetical protein
MIIVSHYHNHIRMYAHEKVTKLATYKNMDNQIPSLGAKYILLYTLQYYVHVYTYAYTAMTTCPGLYCYS